MLAQPPVWLILVAFIAAIGPLVFIHEMGHYLVARWCGVGAETFSIGFGREVFGWTDRRGTRWKIGWLPLGGYVKFIGDMTPASQNADLSTIPAADRNRAFQVKPVWKRFLIVLAGPMANFLLAILIIAGFFATFGVPSTPNLVGQVMPGSAAARAGLIAGDRITAIDGRETRNFEAIGNIAVLHPGERVTLSVERGGRSLALPTLIASSDEVDRFGQHFRVGRLGILNGQRQFERVPPLRLIPAAVVKTVEITRSMIDGLGQIISGRRSVKELGGPIKMAQVAGQTASLGVFEFTQLIVLFSINLGFINLLPIPMLDGGHLMFYAVEAVRRKPVSATAQDWAYRGGLAFLLALLLFVTANDLSSIGLVDRLGRLIG